MNSKWYILPALLIFLVVFSQFVNSESFTFTVYDDFILGDFDNISIEDDENLTLGFSNTTDWEHLVDNGKMILYYKFNNINVLNYDLDNDTSTFDYTDNGLNGTLAGAAYNKNGKFGECLFFEQPLDTLATSSSVEFDNAQNMTVEFWFKFSSVLTGFPLTVFHILGDMESTSFIYAKDITLNLDDGSSLSDFEGFYISNVFASDSNISYIMGSPVLEEWYHIAVIFEGNSSAEYDNQSSIWKTYLNGVLMDTSYQNHSFLNFTDGWNISIGSLFQLDGCIDEFIIYNEVLEPADILQDYEAGLKHFSYGEYISKIYTATSPSTWDSISWVNEIPTDTEINIAARNSDNTNDWTEWDDLTNPSDEINDSSKYLQFKINMSTLDIDVTPKILSLQIDYTLPDTNLPIIISHDILPKVTYPDQFVEIEINGSDSSGINSAIANITIPDGSYEEIELVNNGTYNYSVVGLKDGTFVVNITINDTLGNEAYVLTNFESRNATSFDVNVTNTTGEQYMTKLNAYYPGTTEVIVSYTSTNGIFVNLPIPDYVFDLEFTTLGDYLTVTLQNVDISLNSDKEIILDGFDGSIVYFINSTYISDDGKARLSYDGTDMNETLLRVFACEDWNFVTDNCRGTMNATTLTQNVDGNYFDVEHIGPQISNGVGLALIIDESWCGDNICDAGFEDTTSCLADCSCTSGQTRECSDNRFGECAIGNETCISGTWVGCPSSSLESCDQKDNDCDGTIDNLAGEESKEDTQCACYNGASPIQEQCNGIDDDCDGEIDEGGQCCEEGENRECGSNTGECTYGTSYCFNNIWGDCSGGVTADPFDICFDGKDNDCDGDIDEDCDHCTNSLKDYDEEDIDCGGVACDACFTLPWWLLIVAGVVILGVLVFLMMSFKKEGKELTWEEVRKKYTPAQP
jgi:hypothetical protein